MGKSNKQHGATLNRPPPVEFVAVTELEAIEAVCAEPITVEVLVRGKGFRFTGRRLRPHETQTLQLLLEAALPPLLPPTEGQEAKYDLQDEGFLKRKDENQRKARALALWWAYPLFRDQAAKENSAAGEWTPEQVTKWLEARNLEDDVLQALFAGVYSRVVESGAQLTRYLGFTSGSNSPES